MDNRQQWRVDTKPLLPAGPDINFYGRYVTKNQTKKYLGNYFRKYLKAILSFIPPY